MALGVVAGIVEVAVATGAPSGVICGAGAMAGGESRKVSVPHSASLPGAITAGQTSKIRQTSHDMNWSLFRCCIPVSAQIS